MNPLKRSSELAIASRIAELANIAFAREVTRKVVDAILPLNDVGSGPPFYCVHCVTGCASHYRFLAEALGPSCKFFGIQTPTAKRNAAFASSIEEMSQFYVNRLNEFQPTGPLIIGGHSAGAAIALEMAQQLRALGRDVRAIIVLDGELYNTGAELRVSSSAYWIQLALNVPRWVRMFYRSIPSKAVARAKSAIATLTGKRDLSVIDPRKVTPDHAAFVNKLFESQFRYVPKEYSGRVVVCVAKTKPFTHLYQVEATWRKIAPAAEIVKFRGTHTSLIQPPDVLAVAEDLSGVFSQVDEAITSPQLSPDALIECPIVAHSGHGAMSDLSPLYASKQTPPTIPDSRPKATVVGHTR